jgi:poly(3-hydroxyalkanoate) synthetase
MMEKKKRKVKSMTSVIKELKQRNKNLDQVAYDRYWKIDRLEKRIRELELLIPKKYYRISFEAMSKDNTIMKKGETIVSDYLPEWAINNLKKSAYHPNTFKLTGIEVMA